MSELPTPSNIVGFSERSGSTDEVLARMQAMYNPEQPLVQQASEQVEQTTEAELPAAAAMHRQEIKHAVPPLPQGIDSNVIWMSQRNRTHIEHEHKLAA